MPRATGCDRGLPEQQEENMSTKKRALATDWVCVALVPLACALACSAKNRNGRIQASGTIEATEVVVGSKVAGQIRELRFEEGSRVKEGDVLALLDHESTDLQLKQAQAGVDLAESQLHLLQNGARTEDIRQAEESLAQAESNLKPAEADYARLTALLAKASVTRKQVDDAEARVKVARAQAQSAGQALKKLKSWARPEDLHAARARVDQARAILDQLNKAVSDATITAPLSGTVTHKPVEAGELAGAGAPIATIVNLERIHVMIYLNEAEIGRVRISEEARITVDAFPGRPFTGKIAYISPVAEFTPKNVQTKEDRVKLVFGVKIELDNPDGALKPGMYADAEIATSWNK
jgi:HlyD family secretion protein